MKKFFLYLAIITIILLNCIITKENTNPKSKKSQSQKKKAKKVDDKANTQFETQTDLINNSKYLKGDKKSSKLKKKQKRKHKVCFQKPLKWGGK